MITRSDQVNRISGSESNIIAAYFRDPNDAQRAISNLSGSGFSKKDIGVAITEHNDTTKSRGWGEKLRSMFSPHEREEYDSHNALDVLEHMGLGDQEARHFRNALAQGGALVTVKADGRLSEAVAILKSCHAITSDGIMADEFASRQTAPSAAEGRQRMELLGETLRVNKERVQRGEVTLRKQTVSEKQNIEVPVQREELVIERHPAQSGRQPSSSFNEGKEIRVPLSEEQVKVEKRPVVREEVEVAKRNVQGTKNVTDTVREEKLKVDKEGDVSVDQPRRKTA
jgi:uncharacterized protein (TIGR02271 family)